MPRFIFCVIFTVLILVSLAVSADTIILKDNKEVKGLVVDEYVDRIVLSTFEGEKVFFRKDVISIQYEDTETRLLKLGKEAAARARYKTAVYYYDAVLKLNPGSIEARDGKIAAVRKELGAGAEIAKEEIELMVALDETTAKAPVNKTAAYEKNIKNLLGLKIKKGKENDICYVDEVSPGSVSAGYGIHKKDMISAIWNESTKYMDYGGIIGKLSGPEFSMIKLGIERKVVFPDPVRLKWDIGLRQEGYFVKDVSGVKEPGEGLIKPGDWILEVNSISTRYMPKDELNGMLSGKKTPLEILIKRDLYVTRVRRR